MVDFGALYTKVSGFTFKPWRIPEADTLGKNWEWTKDTYSGLSQRIATTEPLITLDDGKLNLLVIGPRAHGKSSFINAVASLSVQERTTVANAGSGGGDTLSVTNIFRHLELPGKFQGFRLCDVRGLTKEAGSSDTLIKDLKSLVKGNIKPQYKFDVKKEITKADKDFYIETPSTENKIHGVIIVFDSTEAYEIHRSHKEGIKAITDTLHDMNVPISVVLTKADRLDPKVKSNIENIYYSKKVLTAIENTTASLGVPRRNIHPVVNFEDDIRFGWKESLPLLVAVRAILSMANHHLYNEEKAKRREAFKEGDKKVKEEDKKVKEEDKKVKEATKK